jgi:hypothetical protein
MLTKNEKTKLTEEALAETKFQSGKAHLRDADQFWLFYPDADYLRRCYAATGPYHPRTMEWPRKERVEKDSVR